MMVKEERKLSRVQCHGSFGSILITLNLYHVSVKPAQPGRLGKTQFLQLTEDLPITQKFQKLAQERFPEKYDDIARRYGAVEYVPNDDYTVGPLIVF
jgi:hypothetical protein